MKKVNLFGLMALLSLQFGALAQTITTSVAPVTRVVNANPLMELKQLTPTVSTITYDWEGVPINNLFSSPTFKADLSFIRGTDPRLLPQTIHQWDLNSGSNFSFSYRSGTNSFVTPLTINSTGTRLRGELALTNLSNAVTFKVTPLGDMTAKSATVSRATINGDIVAQSATFGNTSVLGRLGINTATPYESFQIGDLFTFHSGGTKYMGYNSYWASSSNKRITDAPASNIALHPDGSIGLYVAESGAAGSDINFKSRLSISNSGITTVTGGLVIKTDAGVQNMAWLPNGKVVIADLTSNPNILNSVNASDFKLYVDGGLAANRLRVAPYQNWADFVFEPNYKLMPLEQLDSYIKTHKHLPEIPSAKEIKENGLDVSKILELQMQKIEELTLYVLELKKEITAIKGQK